MPIQRSSPNLIVLTRFYYSHIGTIPHLPGGHILTNLLIKFHEERTINVVSRDKCAAPLSTINAASRLFTRQFSHVIQLTGTILELNSRIKKTNVLSKFHENWAKHVTSTVFTCFHYIHIEKNAPPTGGHDFSRIPTIFEPMKTAPPTGRHANILTNFELGRDFIRTTLVKK
ncbi:hypothetical protein DPMN_110136 [Dreissena polymorpha]|uniref:Uncharacterized protein n=1 Tax=Dreissena polymorpha TaxID=45954 RepID=A0A9D4QMN6_DREPO|nr:hypothetical protein DPMN_110136 [Dreissena polymorpha]